MINIENELTRIKTKAELRCIKQVLSGIARIKPCLNVTRANKPSTDLTRLKPAIQVILATTGALNGNTNFYTAEGSYIILADGRIFNALS